MKIISKVTRTRTETAITRASLAIMIHGLDLKKDFFELDGNELQKLEAWKKACRYDGKNYMGRSKLRQFWYYLQWGEKKYQEWKRKQL